MLPTHPETVPFSLKPVDRNTRALTTSEHAATLLKRGKLPLEVRELLYPEAGTASF